MGAKIGLDVARQISRNQIRQGLAEQIKEFGVFSLGIKKVILEGQMAIRRFVF